MSKRSWNSFTPVEVHYWQLGYSLIAGVDEVGRGAIAGPLVVAALILPKDYLNPAIKDSKELSPLKREKIAEILKKEALSYSISWIEVEEINRLGIFKAFLLGIKRSLAQLSVAPELLLIDGPHALKDYKGLQKCLVKGDKLSLNIAGASILAKVERDHFMENLERLYPGYGFAKHKGYATPEHLQILQRLGPSPVHRTAYPLFRTLSPG